MSYTWNIPGMSVKYQACAWYTPLLSGYVTGTEQTHLFQLWYSIPGLHLTWSYLTNIPGIYQVYCIQKCIYQYILGIWNLWMYISGLYREYTSHIPESILCLFHNWFIPGTWHLKCIFPVLHCVYQAYSIHIPSIYLNLPCLLYTLY